MRNITPLTNITDWTNYYKNQQCSKLRIPSYLEKILERHVWSSPPGKVFELGCGMSAFLIRSSILGWTVSGIDFNEPALNLLRSYMEKQHLKFERLILGDLTSADVGSLANDYDFLVSFGVIEHFLSPSKILESWKLILKPGGRVLTVVPNLLSLNGWFLRKYDPILWGKHVVINTAKLDMIHKDAGLHIIRPAVYSGFFDIDMLIPWDKFKQRLPIWIIRLLRYIGTVLSMFSKWITFDWHSRHVSPLVYGVYRK